MAPVRNNLSSQFFVQQVSCIEEARAFTVDPFNIYIFPDFKNGKMYMKRMNDDGISDMLIYSLDKPGQTLSVEDRITALEEKINGLSATSTNEQPAVISESNDNA